MVNLFFYYKQVPNNVSALINIYFISHKIQTKKKIKRSNHHPNHPFFDEGKVRFGMHGKKDTPWNQQERRFLKVSI